MNSPSNSSLSFLSSPTSIETPSSLTFTKTSSYLFSDFTLKQKVNCLLICLLLSDLIMIFILFYVGLCCWRR